MVAAVAVKSQNSCCQNGLRGISLPGGFASEGTWRMSILLFVIGAIAVMAGVALVAFGIPINEFSFGNTLIVSGTTAATGGLIVIGLGAAVSQLHRIAEMLAGRTPARAPRPHETPEAAQEVPIAAPPATHVPFPPRERPEPSVRKLPEPSEPPLAPPAGLGETSPAQYFGPTLRNPEAPPLAAEDDVSLSPSTRGSGATEQGREPVEPPKRPPWSPTPQRELPASDFDAMWPPEPKPPRGPVGSEGPAMPRFEHPPREPVAPPEIPVPPAASPPRTAAILKSGVVDGMAYTLYVDGSIQAELPQGTLRFASIEELRSHLDRNA
jgi:hypothetical protein